MYSIEAIINFSCTLRPICSKIIVNCRLTKQSSHDLTALSINRLVRIKLVSHVFPEAAFVKAPPRSQCVRVGRHGVPSGKMSLSHPHIQRNETTNFAGGKAEVGWTQLCCLVEFCSGTSHVQNPKLALFNTFT